ncbi:hypothetical protein J6590_044830 [Homalodisca vitripennis]|nr:hypothetical protein J6590_044830 [Homalodisca vitripennis]
MCSQYHKRYHNKLPNRRLGVCWGSVLVVVRNVTTHTLLTAARRWDISLPAGTWAATTAAPLLRWGQTGDLMLFAYITVVPSERPSDIAFSG